MKEAVFFEQNYDSIKEKLREYMGKRISVHEIKTKNKTIHKKGVLKLVSDNLFVFDVPLGKYHTDACSYTFYDIKMGKVKVDELEEIGA